MPLKTASCSGASGVPLWSSALRARGSVGSSRSSSQSTSRPATGHTICSSASPPGGNSVYFPFDARETIPDRPTQTVPVVVVPPAPVIVRRAFQYGASVVRASAAVPATSRRKVAASAPYAKFTIKIVNGSDVTVDANEMTVDCAYGDEGKEGEGIYGEGLDGLPDTRILAGRSLTVPWACELPRSETFLQVEVSPDYDSEEAVFTGNVKK